MMGAYDSVPHGVNYLTDRAKVVDGRWLRTTISLHDCSHF